MIIAFYIPEELADAYRKERFQPTLARLKRYAKQAGTPTDLKIVQQLEASFCVSREIVNGNAEGGQAMTVMHTAETADPAPQQKSHLSKLANTYSNLLNKRCNYCSELNRQKYKRCLAMAAWCDATYYQYPSFGEISKKEEWWQKWHVRWLELANEFKDGRR